MTISKNLTPWFNGKATIQAGTNIQNNLGSLLQDNLGNLIIPNPYYAALPQKPPTVWTPTVAS